MAPDQPNQKGGKSSTATAKGAISPNNVAKRPKERVPNKLELTEINEELMCTLCTGYLIDATAIIECQHTFCKSCILKYIEKTPYCPCCDIELNTVKPHLSLRSDVILQRLVYKLVPSLLVSELRRRKDHAEGKENIVKAAESVSETMALEVDAASDLSTILSLDDVVSLSIEYFTGSSTPTGNDEPNSNVNVNVKPKPASQKQEKLSAATAVHQTIEDVNNSTDANDRRYLKCPAAVSVGLLKKFIRMKYGLSDDYRVDLLYNGNRDSLESELTLLDVAFIFKWNKDEPMRFQYQIFDRAVKSLPTRAGSKRSASSMMDEPPDDDAASGPHNNNRPPMTSSTPSSKIPRVSNNSSTTGANNNSSGRTGGSSRTTSHTQSTSPSTPVYDFSGNSDTEEPIQPMQHKGKLKLRGLRKETSNTSNVIASSNTTNSQSSKRSPSSMHHKRSSPEGRRRSSGSGSGSGKSPGRSNSVGTTGDSSEDADSDSSSSDESDGTKTAELTNSRVRSAAQTVMAGQVNGSIKLSMSSEKREPLKLSLGSVLAKSPEHKHKHKHHHKMKHKKKHKPLKISLSLNSVGSNSGSGANSINRGNVNQSQNNHTKPTGVGSGSGVKVEGKEPKLIFGLGQNKSTEGGKVGGNGPTGSTNSQSNFPVNVKPTTSAHLSNMSKSISVSIGVGNNSQKPGNNVTSAGGNQLAKKILNSTTTTTIVPNKKKNSEIQPNANSSSNSNQSSARSHPLLPDSVHVPKSVTLIPVNPTGGSTNSSSSTTSSGRGGGNILSGNILEKSGSVNSGSSTSNRLNAHTFTNPITNRSLHQITVTEVPPPPKSGGSSPASTSSAGISANNSGNNSKSNTTSNAPSSCPNPIEKVIANAANKPQFSGPGSMEITKIYCNSKENPTKKLKERKGLDISITVPTGMNIKDKNKTSKLEETLRQKMGLHNNINSSSSATTNSSTMANKIKGNNGPAGTGPLFNAGKMPPGMPPGITIGPAGVHKQQQSISGSGSSTTSGNTTIPGLGFTLPPHITAHPQHPPTAVSTAKQSVVNQMMKQQHQHQAGENKPSPGIKGKNVQMGGGNKTKDLPICCIGSGGVPKGNQATKAYENRKQLGEALASMIDMANRNALKSPSPPKNSQQASKDYHHQKTSGGVKLNQSSTTCEKRALDMSSSSSSSRKNSRESPEPKRSKTNESSGLSTPKSSTNESPLDLSGTGRPISRPNSNSSSPIHHHNLKNSHSSHHEKVLKHNEPLQSGGGKKCPTPVPKVSPPTQITTTTTPTGFPSPSGKSGGKASTPTGSSPSILSIAQNLAQKQLNQQQQQQKEQFLHNQIMHLQQGLQNMHAGSSLSHSHHLQQQQTGKVGSVSLLGNSLSPKGSHAPHNSLSPPIMSLPNPSPPSQTPSGFDPLRNLLTLSDAAMAARHGKVHPMNSLMAAVGMCPPNHHAGLSLPSPTSVTSANSLFPHLVNSLGGKSVGGGMLDPGSAHAYLAQAISAHNERLAVAAGMGHFHGDSSMSPPMSLGGNSFFSQQVRPNNSPHGNLRIPSASASTSTLSNKAGSGGSSTSSGHGKNNVKQLGSPPVAFSQHPTPPSTVAPRSPNRALGTSTTTAASSHSNKSHHHDSPILSNMKPTRINGTTTFGGHLPIFPPGIHNPILPTYSRSKTITNCSSSTSSPNPISSSTSATSSTSKVSGSDKKGIPESMNISNFLPSKPKDGKGQPDNSHAEATITSGSNVGGGTSLTKFLNSIPPLIVSQQSNLSVSPSSSSATLPKEQALTSSSTSRGLSTNKSSNEQECRPKSKSSELKSTFPSSSSSSVHNPIKIEPSEKKPSSIIPLKSTLTDPITCSTSPPKSTGWKLGEEKATTKSVHSSSEIKSEGATTLMSSIRSKIGIFSLGSPPASRTTTNQAVRQIPNPALLFNRQNSSNSGSSPITSPTNEYGKSLPFSQKSPLKLEETGLTLIAPSLPFPGVSVPVQVKVDNDAAPIPIPTPKPNPATVQHQQLGSLSPRSIPEPTTKISPEASSTEVVVETELLIAQPPNKEVQDTVKSPSVPTTETANQICTAEEIIKIEYTTEDADLDVDIDVGIEAAPILFHSSKDNEVEPPTVTREENEDEKVEQNTQSTCPVVEVDVPETNKIEDIPTSSGAILSDNEIKTENTSATLDVADEQDDTKTQPSPSVTSEDAQMHSSTPQVLERTGIEENDTISEEEKVSTNSILPEEKARQVEIEEKVEEGVKEKAETGLATTTESCTETPMEVVHQENEKLEKEEGKMEEEKPGEIPEVAVDISSSGENVILTTESTQPTEIPTNFDKSAELQIESMECEEAPQLQLNVAVDEDHDMTMETKVETDHEVVPMAVDDEKDVTDLKESVNLTKIQETIPSQTTENEEELPVATEIKEAEVEAAFEIQVAQEQNSLVAATAFSEEFTICDTNQEVVDETSNEDDLPSTTPTLLIHTSNSDSQIQTKALKLEESPESNSILNQIIINPEALQVADTDIMPEPTAITNDEPVRIEVEPSFEEEVSLADNSPSKNNTEATILVKDDEEERKLTESLSTSLLELNCLSADTGVTELSNPDTITVSESEVHTTSEEIFPVDHVLIESMNTEELNKNSVTEKCENVQTTEVTSTESNVEVEELLFEVGDKVEEICSTPVVRELDAGINTDENEMFCETSIVNFEFEFDPQLTTPVPESTFSLSLPEAEDVDGDVKMSDKSLQIIPDSQKPTSPVTTFTLDEGPTTPSSPSLISATATITTSTAEISSNVMSSSIESSISSRNSLESPTSPEEDIKKMETLEQVAAGLFAANTMNNNNNKTINAPSCEIAITTTSANDMATV